AQPVKDSLFDLFVFLFVVQTDQDVSRIFAFALRDPIDRLVAQFGTAVAARDFDDPGLGARLFGLSEPVKDAVFDGRIFFHAVKLVKIVERLPASALRDPVDGLFAQLGAIVAARDLDDLGAGPFIA